MLWGWPSMFSLLYIRKKVWSEACLGCVSAIQIGNDRRASWDKYWFCTWQKGDWRKLLLEQSYLVSLCLVMCSPSLFLCLSVYLCKDSSESRGQQAEGGVREGSHCFSLALNKTSQSTSLLGGELALFAHSRWATLVALGAFCDTNTLLQG